MWYANIIAAVAFFLLGVATILFAWLELPYTADFSPGPGFLPLWLGIGMALSAVPVIAIELRRADRSKAFFKPETVKSVKVLMLITAVFLLLPVFGFSAGLALITGGGMRLMGNHGWGSCAAVVVVTAVCIHYLFGQWLSIPLPTGLIGW